MDSILNGFFLLLIMIITIVIAYCITSIIGNKTKGLMNRRYTQVLERTMIGLNTNITIIKVNKKIYIIALQGKSIKVLDTINESEWEFSVAKSQNSFDFKNQMNDIFKSKSSNK